MHFELLLIYNLVGLSKKEIIAKRPIFQRKIWTNLENNSEPKWQNNQLQGRAIARNFETFVGDKRPPGETRKKFGTLGTH